jgi:hypothetical protein
VATDPLSPLLPNWIECISDHLTTPVERVTMMPGSDIVWDVCDCGGQLWIRVVSIVGAAALSEPAGQPCAGMYQIRCGIGIVRCAHTVDDEGNPPTPAEMTADALQTFQDRADIIQGILCCIAPCIDEDYSMGTLRIEDWLPVGPQGGCVGGEVTITFNQVLCAPCPEEDAA